jgi:hypothetical protein
MNTRAESMGEPLMRSIRMRPTPRSIVSRSSVVCFRLVGDPGSGERSIVIYLGVSSSPRMLSTVVNSATSKNFKRKWRNWQTR